MSAPSTDGAKVYRDAAQGMEYGIMGMGWSCWAICDAAKLPCYGDDESPPSVVKRYERVFSPHRQHVHLWADDWSHDERILALCFMAAMVEAGDA